MLSHNRAKLAAALLNIDYQLLNSIHSTIGNGCQWASCAWLICSAVIHHAAVLSHYGAAIYYIQWMANNT